MPSRMGEKHTPNCPVLAAVLRGKSLTSREHLGKRMVGLADDFRTLAAQGIPEVPALAQLPLYGIDLNGVSTQP